MHNESSQFSSIYIKSSTLLLLSSVHFSGGQPDSLFASFMEEMLASYIAADLYASQGHVFICIHFLNNK